MAEDPELLRAIERLTAIVEGTQIETAIDFKKMANSAKVKAQKLLYHNAPSQVPQYIRDYTLRADLDHDKANSTKTAKSWTEWKNIYDKAKKEMEDSQKKMDKTVDDWFENEEEKANNTQTQVKMPMQYNYKSFHD